MFKLRQIRLIDSLVCTSTSTVTSPMVSLKISMLKVQVWTPVTFAHFSFSYWLSKILAEKRQGFTDKQNGPSLFPTRPLLQVVIEWVPLVPHLSSSSDKNTLRYCTLYF